MNYFNFYVNFLKKFLKLKRPMKIIFDCSNGTTGSVLKKLFPRAIFINAKPDGNFPAHGPDPLARGAIKQLQRKVKKQRADLGIIFDADGDRVFFVDDKGRLIDSNEITYVLIKLFKPPFIIGASLGWRVRNEKGITISRIGHYFIKKAMRAKKANFGAELTGHYYFSALGGYWDSGIFAAIQVINFVSGLKEKISEYLENLQPKYYRSGEINIELRVEGEGERILAKIEKYYKKRAIKISKVDGLTMEFSWGWFNLRLSNTENLIRLNVEVENRVVLEKKLKEVKSLLK